VLRNVIFVIGLMSVMPALAQAQSTTVFDGTYSGISNTASGGGRNCVPAVPLPRPLTIRGGVASWAAGLSGDIAFQGTVSPQGDLSARGSNGISVLGKIDASGQIIANSIGTGNCTIQSIWRK